MFIPVFFFNCTPVSLHMLKCSCAHTRSWLFIYCSFASLLLLLLLSSSSSSSSFQFLQYLGLPTDKHRVVTVVALHNSIHIIHIYECFNLLNHLCLMLSKMPMSLIRVLSVHLPIYLYALPLFTNTHFEFRKFFLRFIISQHFRNMPLPSSSPKHNGFFFFPVFFSFPFYFHAPPCNYDIQLLSFLEQQFVYYF